MLSDADRQKAAQLLLAAERERKPMVQLSKTWPDITFEDAYAIQGMVQLLRRSARLGVQVISRPVYARRPYQ